MPRDTSKPHPRARHSHALVVFAHPEPQSFNGTLKDTAVTTLKEQGYAVEVSDLYGEGFDPAERPAHYPERTDRQVFEPLAEQRRAYEQESLPPEVQREIDRLERANLVVFQFPLWWHAQPAILKGWMDRVFVNGGLYTSSMRYNRGYFRGRRSLVSVTTGGPAETFAHNGRGGDIELLLWPLHYSLHYMGFTVLPAFRAHGIHGNGYAYQDAAGFRAHLEDTRQAWAARLRRLETAQPLRFADWDDWDESGRLKPGIKGYDYFIRAQP
ncbi:NAD(P)H-dependent oxidoreductase [Fodinicurvata fenggangensis]|uniref:NAD(P)H-dependent oxidoreductase n=1 Tax=Fodinicurvata fenggangensis TaxID=1121830 RepID=UPI00068EA368|nr:NAD(P)H-dependent oxidoreductase [Fodinicurvata fenggangensis]